MSWRKVPAHLTICLLIHFALKIFHFSIKYYEYILNEIGVVSRPVGLMPI
jgi:hypothetical protein